MSAAPLAEPVPSVGTYGAPALTPSARYLMGRHRALGDRVRAAVLARQSVDPEPDDRFRGLYVSDEQARALLEDRPGLPADVPVADAELEAWADGVVADGGSLALRHVAHAFGLDPLDVEVLVVALGPDLDPRLERAYGYLHDDVTRRRASIGLALELCGRSVVDAEARGRFSAGAPLVTGGLVTLEEVGRPFLSRGLRVPDVVVSHLLGREEVDPTLVPFVTTAVPSDSFDTAMVRRGLAEGMVVHVRDRVGAAAWSFVATVARDLGRPLVALDLTALSAEDDALGVVRAAVRQVRLIGGMLGIAPVEDLARLGLPAVRALSEGHAVVAAIGDATWDPSWSVAPPLLVDAPDITEAYDSRLSFRLTPEQSLRARAAAEQQAAADGAPVRLDHLALGARSQNAGGLERLALRVAPSAGWDDVILPDDTRTQLRELANRVAYRDAVLDDWGLRRGAAKGRGVTALFSGDSGTGKTLAAEVMAHELRMDLYVIDLATVVDKYIGETEKHLDRIFREADRVNGVLLFDEADAIFGKRSEVQDARDRYANVEVAYLLQRMERFDGIAILTTNLRANIDDAFLRRLDALVDFPNPDDDLRRRLWDRHLPPGVPRADDVDLEHLARSFELSGGNIRSITMAAAFLAAADGSQLTMESLIRATAREYRKLGRLCVPGEFGRYYDLIAR